MNLKESDWRYFKTHVPTWRERYLIEKNREARSILEDSSSSPTDVFWSALEFLKSEAKTLRDCFDNHSRSKMLLSLALMYRHGIVRDEDLTEFSQEVQDRIRMIVDG